MNRIRRTARNSTPDAEPAARSLEIPTLRRDWGPRLRRPAAAVGAFLLGVVITAVLSLWTANRQEADATEAFGEKASLVADSLTRAVSDARTRVLGLQGLFAASEEVTGEEFREYAVRVWASEGSQQLGFARRVPAEELTEFLAEVRINRPDFSFRLNGGEAERSVHYPIWFLADFERTSDLVGLDLATLPAMDSAIDKAIRSGDTVLAGLDEGCDETTTCEVTILAPARDVDGSTGVVFSTLRIGQLLNRLVSETDDQLYWRLDEVSSEQTITQLAEPDRWRETLHVVGRRWLLEVRSEQPYQALASHPLQLLMLLGTVASLLAAATVYAIADDIETRRRITHLEQLHEERDRFLGALSHELRTPLTAVLGVVKILAAEWRDSKPNDVQELLDIAEAQASELSDLTDDLLLVGRASSDTLNFVYQKVDLHTTATALLRQLDIRSDVSVEITDAKPIVWADPGRVRQILRNLIGNAVRYAQSAVKLDVETDPDRVRLLIANDGPPIDPDKVEHLFDPYTSDRFDRHPNPIGLGLYVSRLLAEAMGGQLNYAYDGSVIFTLELPTPPPSPIESWSTTAHDLARSK